MSKTLLQRIKPRRNPKTQATQNFPVTTHIKKLINEVCEIVRTQPQWEETLETRLYEEEIVPSEIAHFVLDKIHNAELGLKFFDWVSNRPYGSPADSFGYSSLLKLLAKSRLFSEVENVFGCMKREKIIPTPEAFDVMIRAYSDCGLVDRALELYSSATKTTGLVPHVLTCNSLLDGLVKNGKTASAMRIYTEIIAKDDCEMNGHLDNYSTGILVKGLCKEGEVEKGVKLIEKRWGRGCIPDIVFYNILIDGYCRRGDVEKASGLFRQLKLKGFLPTLETYGAMINGFCREGNFEKVDGLLEEMRARGLAANACVYNNIIDAKHKHGYGIEVTTETARKMIHSGCQPDIVTYNTLISISCRNGKLQEAEKLLKQARSRALVPNKFSYTPLIHLLCEEGNFDRASDLLVEMTECGDKPDLLTYGALVHGLVVAGQVDVALAVRDKMMERGVFPDAGIYNVLMSGFCKSGKVSVAKQLLAEMLDYNMLPDAYVYATLVDGIARSGDLDGAKKLFEQMIERGINPGVVEYNAMIKGFCKFGMMKDAVFCLSEMMKRNISPDEFTYSTIIDGHIKQHYLDGALMMFGQMLKHNCTPNVVTYTTLINGFCQSGNLFGAEKVFREMQLNDLLPNVVTYTTLIGSFCKVGQLRKAACLFDQMLIRRCIPNDVTFHFLVKGFSKGLPHAVSNNKDDSEHDKSMFLDIYGKMISDGWFPQTASHTSILVCLCLQGMLQTALKFRDKMVSKGCISSSVSFPALLHCICIEGKSQEWTSFISCDLSQPDLRVAKKYLLTFDSYVTSGLNSQASLILQSLVEDYQSDDHNLSRLEILQS